MEERDDYYNMYAIYDDAFDIMCNVIATMGFEYTPYPEYKYAKVYNILEYDAERIFRRVHHIYWSNHRRVTVNGSAMSVIIKNEDNEFRDYKFQFDNEEDFKTFGRILIDETLLFQSNKYYYAILVYLIPESTAKRLYSLIKEKELKLLS